MIAEGNTHSALDEGINHTMYGFGLPQQSLLYSHTTELSSRDCFASRWGRGRRWTAWQTAFSGVLAVIFYRLRVTDVPIGIRLDSYCIMLEITVGPNA